MPWHRNGLVLTVTAGVEEQGKGTLGSPGNVGEPVVSIPGSRTGGTRHPKPPGRVALTRRATRSEAGVGDGTAVARATEPVRDGRQVS